MKYTLTVVELETGAWSVIDNTGRQVWASPWLEMACRTAANVLDSQQRAAEWSASVSPAATRSNRARRAAGAQRDRMAS